LQGSADRDSDLDLDFVLDLDLDCPFLYESPEPPFARGIVDVRVRVRVGDKRPD